MKNILLIIMVVSFLSGCGTMVYSGVETRYMDEDYYYYSSGVIYHHHPDRGIDVIVTYVPFGRTVLREPRHYHRSPMMMPPPPLFQSQHQLRSPDRQMRSDFDQPQSLRINPPHMAPAPSRGGNRSAPMIRPSQSPRSQLPAVRRNSAPAVRHQLRSQQRGPMSSGRQR